MGCGARERRDERQIRTRLQPVPERTVAFAADRVHRVRDEIRQGLENEAVAQNVGSGQTQSRLLANLVAEKDDVEIQCAGGKPGLAASASEISSTARRNPLTPASGSVVVNPTTRFRNGAPSKPTASH